MKNSTLVRIKVPKALYESALRKALLEAGDKEPKGGHSSKKYAKEDDYSKPAKKVNPAGKHSDKEPKKGGGAHKGKAFVKDDAYTEKVSTKKSLGETKKKVKEAVEIEKFRTLTPNREIYKDANRMQEKKGKIEEINIDWAVAGPALAFMAPILGVSKIILQGTLKKMKEQGLSGIDGFIKAFKQSKDEAGEGAQKSKETLGERKRKMEESKKKMHEKHDDTAEDTKLIKKLVKPSALKGKK